MDGHNQKIKNMKKFWSRLGKIIVRILVEIIIKSKDEKDRKQGNNVDNIDKL